MRWIDIVILFLLTAVAVIVSVIFETSFLISILLFFAIPSLWLTVRNIRKTTILKKAAKFSLVLGIPMATVVDYIAVVNKQWFIPESFFSYRLFDVVVVEQYIFTLLIFYYIVLFYEHFLDRGENHGSAPGLKILGSVYWGVLLVVIVTIIVFPGTLSFPYAYTIMGFVVGVIPLIIFFVRYNRPILYKKFVIAGAYFFVVLTAFELVAIELGQWVFPKEGDFIGSVTLFGYTFPFEEFFLWLILFTVGLLSYYEYFSDDRK